MCPITEKREHELERLEAGKACVPQGSDCAQRKGVKDPTLTMAPCSAVAEVDTRAGTNVPERRWPRPARALPDS